MAGGASFYQDDDPPVISEINVTPLVDVVLVLLIIFMVATKLIAERGISAELPKTSTGGPVDTKLALTIACDKETPCALGEAVLFVNGERMDRERAGQAVSALRSGNPELKALISADKNIPHGEVMSVIDLVKLSGVTKFALASSPKPIETSSETDTEADESEAK